MTGVLARRHEDLTRPAQSQPCGRDAYKKEYGTRDCGTFAIDRSRLDAFTVSG